MRISERVRKIAPSLTLAVSQKAAKLRAEGVDIVSFGAGEPDFDTPAHIKQAAVDAMARGASKYTHVAGTAELRKAVAEELNRAHGTRLAVENVVVSCGAKHSLFNLFMALLDDGDEVIIPSPCWVSYPELVAMAGGVPVLLETHPEEGYGIDEARLRAAITPLTRAVLLCSPSNPTGAVYGAATLAAVARAVQELGSDDTYIITDDIYRSLVYQGEWASMARVAPELASRCIFVDGVSKSYAMTGWRIGYCAAPKDLVEGMVTLQGQSTTNAAAVSQAAALAAIAGPQDCVAEMRTEFDRRRQTMVRLLRDIPGLRVCEPQGAFYCFVDVRHYIGGGIDSDVALADRLLDKGRVAVVPGTGFLAPGFVRLSYATSMKNVEEGLRRMAETFAALRAESGGAAS